MAYFDKPIYCTHKELKKTFPSIDEYDVKTPIHGFVPGIVGYVCEEEQDTAGANYTTDFYYAPDTGYVEDLYINGTKCISKFPWETQVFPDIGDPTNVDDAVYLGTLSGALDNTTGIRIDGSFGQYLDLPDNSNKLSRGDVLLVFYPEKGTNHTENGTYEYIYLHGPDLDTWYVDRGLFGTTPKITNKLAHVFKMVDGSKYYTRTGWQNGVSSSADDVNFGRVAPFHFWYDPYMDTTVFTVYRERALLYNNYGKHATHHDDDPNDFRLWNPEDALIEAGFDWRKLSHDTRYDASRMLDSLLDSSLPKIQTKTTNGKYDFIIIRTAALLSASMLIKASDPLSEVAKALNDEALENIRKLNNGEAVLERQKTSDSSEGTIISAGRKYEDITMGVQGELLDAGNKGGIYPVDTRGNYSGIYDLLLVKITLGGAIGTAKYSVWCKDADGLQNNQIITDEVITGDYQKLAGGLQIRFAVNSEGYGSTYNTSHQHNYNVAVVDDEWEIEVHGWSEKIDASTLKPIRMTRRWQ
jgi:hypothetical protein